MRNKLYPKLFSLTLGFLTIACHDAYAAVAVDMHSQAPGYLQGLLNTQNTPAKVTSANSPFKMISRNIDFNQTIHTRFKQTYHGFDVWNGEMIVHAPHASNVKAGTPQLTASGVIYDQLDNDLAASQADASQRQMIAEKAAASYIKEMQLRASAARLKTQTIVYVDSKTNKAVWTYLVTFMVVDAQHRVYEPSMIVDAQSQVIYQQWDRIDSVVSQSDETVLAGGYGGNPNVGKLEYGMTDQYPGFTVERISSYDPLSKDFRGNCYMHDSIVKVAEGLAGSDIEFYFPCHDQDAAHNNLYWNADFMSVNDGYSPLNDAIYGTHVVSNLFRDWYGLPLYAEADHTTPKQITIEFIPAALDWVTDYSNWDTINNEVVLGSGGEGYYPFTSIGILAHELGHAFTSQHSNLSNYYGTGAMNESFSDLAAQATQYYLTGKNDWRIGKDIIADPMVDGCKDVQDCAIRYMDNPTKDEKSFDNVVDAMIYHPNIHYSSGVFNKMFYLLATKPNWNTKMVFNVMVQANMNYWTSSYPNKSDYKQIACGIIAAAKDYQAKDAAYDLPAVISALKAVGFKDDGLAGPYPDFDYDLKSCE